MQSQNPESLTGQTVKNGDKHISIEPMPDMIYRKMVIIAFIIIQVNMTTIVQTYSVFIWTKSKGKWWSVQMKKSLCWQPYRVQTYSRWKCSLYTNQQTLQTLRKALHSGSLLPDCLSRNKSSSHLKNIDSAYRLSWERVSQSLQGFFQSVRDGGAMIYELSELPQPEHSNEWK